VEGCEIDGSLSDQPKDFFSLTIEKKYDLIIGNPPFTKYNLRESYYHPKKYLNNSVSPHEYLPPVILKKEKEKIENGFILKSLRHLKDKNSTIAFILPISFFIRNKNKIIKKEILNHFSTVIIYQDREVWFNYNIPCCFAIFTNTFQHKDKLILIYKNEHEHREIININRFFEEVIPEVFYNKKYGLTNNHKGALLKNYLSMDKAEYSKSFKTNNVSAKNILEKVCIPLDKTVEDYKVAVVRVGNASVGRCGLVNTKEDVLNDMFFVFDFAEQYNNKRQIKERICALVNSNPDYFRNITCRVGSKSIKKEDIYNFKVAI